MSSPLCGVRTRNAQYSVNGILSVLCGHLNEVFERLLRDNPHSAQAARDVSVRLNKLGAFLDGCGIRRRSSFSMIGEGGGWGRDRYLQGCHLHRRVDAVLLAQIRNGFAFDQMFAQDRDLMRWAKKTFGYYSFIEACSFRPRVA